MAHFIYMEQSHALAHYERPEIPNIYSEIDEETVIHSEDMSVSDLKRQEQALDYYNRTKESLPQDPAGISRIESQIQERDFQANAPYQEDDGFQYLFDTSQIEEQDDWHTLKLLVYLERKKGSISPTQHVNQGRFLTRRSQLEAKHNRLVRLYGKRPLNKHDFDSKLGYSMYRMSWFIWGDHVIQSDGSDDLDDYGEFFDPNAPFSHPDMKCNPYDPKENNVSDDSVVDVDMTGSYPDLKEVLKPDDPIFDEIDDLDLNEIFHWIDVCFGSQFDSTPASASGVSADKSHIFKGPKPQAVKDTDDADLTLATEMSLGKVSEDTKSKISEDQPAPEMDTLPRKRRMTDPMPEAIENKQSKRRKLLYSPPKHGVNQEEERCLLLNTDNEYDEDYEILWRLYWYTVNQRTSIFQGGAFVLDFENGVTKFINLFLDSKITTDQCKKKVMELREKFLCFMELNGNEDFNEADFYVPHEYKMFQMFKIVWGDDRGRGGSCSVADPISATVTNVSGAGKAPEPANVKSGAADKELEADMARAVSNSLKEIREDTMLQGAISDIRELDMKVDSGSVQDSGENIYVQDNMDIDR
ncbi:hypothetical protein DCAR_0831078 [Daucus carota subsp. sativus]|uniref:Uncharacterized protein n=1 Tax=Daucus carota subsp. sativus TaxID=79200 RepID=A0A175YL77_DAUCS|nr:hypothetical protein DCAR_0831078 [Daucus carota subsp. sativus]